MDNWDNVATGIFKDMLASGAGTVQPGLVTFITAADLSGVSSGNIIKTTTADNESILLVESVDADTITVSGDVGFYQTGATNFEVWSVYSIFGDDVINVVVTEWNTLYRYTKWDDQWLPVLDYIGSGNDILNPDDVTKSEISDSQINDRSTEAEAREDRVVPGVGESLSLLEKDIVKITTSGTNLYGTRYTWISARLHTLNGLMQRILMFDLERAERELEVIENVMKVEGMESI